MHVCFQLLFETESVITIVRSAYVWECIRMITVIVHQLLEGPEKKKKRTFDASVGCLNG